MTEDDGADVRCEEGVDIIEMISGWRRTFRRLSSDKLLVFIKRQIKSFNSLPKEARDPGEFARRLLLAYKVGSAIAADDDGHVPFGVTYCFTYRDADHILNNDPSLLSRRFLCTLKNHDFVEEDGALVLEILGQLESYADIRTPNRDPICVQTKHIRCSKTRGSLRVGYNKHGLPDSEANTGLKCYYRRFHVR